jgi:hypothetical protein
MAMDLYDTYSHVFEAAGIKRPDANREILIVLLESLGRPIPDNLRSSTPDVVDLSEEPRQSFFPSSVSPDDELQQAIQLSIAESQRRIQALAANPITVPQRQPLNLDRARRLPAGLRAQFADTPDLPIPFQYAPAHRQELPPEPEVGLTIAVYLANGVRVCRKFAAEQSSADLYVWVASLGKRPASAKIRDLFAIVFAEGSVIRTDETLGERIQTDRVTLNVIPLPRPE